MLAHSPGEPAGADDTVVTDARNADLGVRLLVGAT